MTILEALRKTTEEIKAWAESKFFNKNNVDATLSATSENPVQNKAVSIEIDNIKGLVGDTVVSEQIDIAITNSVADWSQEDSSAPDYIKNKPNEIDAIELATNMGLVSPAAADDGSIYTDENGALYIL